MHLEGRVEQACFQTVDVTLSKERAFVRAWVKRMLTLFLLNKELEASRKEVRGGALLVLSRTRSRELMIPRPKK